MDILDSVRKYVPVKYQIHVAKATPEYDQSIGLRYVIREGEKILQGHYHVWVAFDCIIKGFEGDYDQSHKYYWMWLDVPITEETL